MEPRTFLKAQFELIAVERIGGMSVVRKARLKETGEICALKYPAKESSEGIASLSFGREMQALADLEHGSIVRLLGLGSDGPERFLVLEWLEETLSDRLKSLGPLDWATFYEQVGRPLLDALRYAHGRNYVHRDLKPLNVMFSAEARPKITDFGIARNIDDVRLGRTLAAAGSHPWTPAEADDGIHSDRRDLYSWAAICIASLTGRQDFKVVAELRTAAEKLGEVAPVRLLLQCLSESPADRPQSATLLLWELDDFHQARLWRVGGERIIGVDISATAHSKLSASLPTVGTLEARANALIADFSESCETLRLPEGDLEFTGNTFRVRAGRASAQSPWLVIKDVTPASVLPVVGATISARIRFVERLSGFDNLELLRANIAFLESILRSAQERELEEQRQRDEERYLNMQQDVLVARIRALRELPTLPYRDGKWDGGEFTVMIDGDEMPDTGEQRIIRTAGGILVFEVSKIAQDRVYLRPIGQRRAQVPAEGRLQEDTVAQRRALERQEEAVKLLRSGLTVFPGLKRIILKPQDAELPEPGGRELPSHLSKDKQEVLDAALGLRQLMLVRGPPGTGKTTLIAEIIKCYLRENPKGRVLVAAQTHIAIDHVITKLLQLPEIAERIVRVARADEDKVAEAVRPTLLHNCLVRWCREAAETSRRFVSTRGAKVGLDAAEVELSVRLEMLVLASERQVSVDELLARGREELVVAQTGALAADERDLAKVESATIATMTVAELTNEQRRLAEQVLRLRNELKLLGPDGAMLSSLPDTGLRDWMSVLEQNNLSWTPFRRELEVQVAWLDLLGQLKRLEAIVLRTASVVAGTCVGLGSSDAFFNTRFDLCIIDEASKATSTEALIPMVRSARCLLVGDPKQLPPFDAGPIDVEGYGEPEVKETLLDYLIARLPSKCIHELTHQHRMCKSIGTLISTAFYEKTLINDRPDSDRPEWMRKQFPKPIVWMNTVGSPQRRQGHTYVNVGEQKVILDILATLNRATTRAKTTASVAVIAGYAAQAYALDAQIQRSSFESLSIEVATVDSFQGKESDVCMFSVTLSNTVDFLGFLRSMKRLNVALSRPKDLLVIVGDQRFCYQAQGENPFIDVIDYIEANRGSCETRNARK